MACYVVALIQGENIKGLQLCHATLMGYVHCILQLHRDQNLPDSQGALINYISLMTDAIKKWEFVPDRCEVIHYAMFQHLIHTSPSNHIDSLHAVAMDWYFLGHYIGFWKSEWCQDSSHDYGCIANHLMRDRPDSIVLIAEDFILKDANGITILIMLATPASTIQHAEMRSWYHKNQYNYQVLTYNALSSPDTCPVRTILHILQ